MGPGLCDVALLGVLIALQPAETAGHPRAILRFCKTSRPALLLSQAHADLRSLYAVGTEALIHALMRQAVSLLRQQQAAAAVDVARQTCEMVQQLRCLPLLQAQAAALLGHCYTVHSHKASLPTAGNQCYAFCICGTCRAS